MPLPRAAALGVIALASLGPACVAHAQCPAWIPGGGLDGINGAYGAAGLAAVTWDPDADGPMNQLTVVAGRFSIAGDTPASNVAAWDGSSWQPLGTGFDGEVMTLGVSNGVLVAGGMFTHADGAPATRVAHWDGASWRPMGDGFDNAVLALEHTSFGLVATGWFRHSGGVTTGSVARWDGTTWSSVGVPPAASGSSAVEHAGELFVGFDSNLGVRAWNGTTWRALPLPPLSSISALCTFNGELIAGGFGLTRQSSVHAWNGTQWRPLRGNIGVEGQVFNLFPAGGSMYAGGTVRFEGFGSASNVLRWDGERWRSMGDGPNALVGGIAQTASGVLVCGTFNRCGTLGTRAVASWDGSQWLPAGSGLRSGAVSRMHAFGPNLLMSGYNDHEDDTNPLLTWNGIALRTFATHNGTAIRAIGEFEGELVVGGDFSIIDGIPANQIARWDGASWRPFGAGLTNPLGIALPYGVKALGAFGGQLVAAGTLGNGSIAIWNGSAWSPLGTGLAPNASAVCEVDSLAEYSGELIAAGRFGRAGGASVANIARWNGSAWSPMGAGLGDSSDTVHSLAVYMGQLLAAGTFRVSGAAPVPFVARWDGTAWQPFGPPFDDSVHTLKIMGGALYAGGEFNSAADVPINSLAVWADNSWAPVADGIGGGARTSVRALATFNSELVVGGDFTNVNLAPATYWARWNPTGLAPIVEHPADTVARTGQSIELRVTPASGYEDLSFQWLHDGAQVMLGAGGAAPGGGTVKGSTEAILHVSGIQRADAGLYACRVTNPCGDTESLAARVDVLCPADFNHDFVVNSADFFEFLSAFFTLDPSADFNADARIDSADFFDFLSAYFKPCA